MTAFFYFRLCNGTSSIERSLSGCFQLGSEGSDFGKNPIIGNPIATCSADCRQHFRCHPALELLCCGQLAGEDEGIEARFVDDYHLLCSTKGALNWGVLFVFIINMWHNGISWLCISQYLSHILTDEPGLPVDCQGADLTKLAVLIDGDCGCFQVRLTVRRFRFVID